jgi:acetolactate synthase-1/2/3 large subunit
MSTAATHIVDRTEKAAETRIASYLLTEYLERLGVEVNFGLCGHTVIAFLDAWENKIRFISTRQASGGARGGRVCSRVSQAERIDAAPGAWIDECATGVADAALDSIRWW